MSETPAEVRQGSGGAPGGPPLAPSDVTEESTSDSVTIVKKPRHQMKMSMKDKSEGSDDEYVNRDAIDSTRETAAVEFSNGSTQARPEDFKRNIDEFEETLKLSKERDEAGNVYMGKKAYHQYLVKSEASVRMGKYTGTQGPIHAPNAQVHNTFFDYHPEMCKDYKETGYCGFGDSCKFIHDRGDYKSGWELEKEWNTQQKKKQLALMSGKAYVDTEEDENAYVVESSDEEELPFACHICRNEFENPVETICGHFFCEKCAMDRARKNKSCAVCGRATGGTFNRAFNLLKRIGEKHSRQDAKIRDT